MDTSRYARFQRPGHARTGDRTGRNPATRVGYQFAHAIVDDHSRLAYVELHPDEQADTIVGFTERAFAWYATHGITPRRVMTDNAWAYTHSVRLRELLARHDVRHLTTKRYRPRTNGKVERFHSALGNRPPISRVRNL